MRRILIEIQKASRWPKREPTFWITRKGLERRWINEWNKPTLAISEREGWRITLDAINNRRHANVDLDAYLADELNEEWVWEWADEIIGKEWPLWIGISR